MKRIDRVKQVIDLKKVEQFITDAHKAADAVEAIANSSKPDDDKLLDMFDALVSLGLCDESELPSG